MKSLAMQIVFPGGEPNGIKIIEVTEWNGKAFIVPRTEIGFLKERSELSESGIYFLFGEDKETGDQLVYIGESSNCANRLNLHNSEKDYWNQAFIFLNPPDRNYLEAVTTKMAKKANRFIIKNDKQPKEEKQNEFDQVKNERYFEGINKILMTFGFSLFESIKESVVSNKFYYLKVDGVNAIAQLLDDGKLNVLINSLARKKEAPSFWGWSLNARKQFLDDGTLKEKGDGISYVYTKDVLFNSPTAAAATTMGRPVNGWTAWKDEDGNTLDNNLRK